MSTDTKTLTIERVSSDIFKIVSNFSYWGDGAPINNRFAFDEKGGLSSSRAQMLDRAAGDHYLLPAPMKITKREVVAAAGSLEVGGSVTVTL